MSWIMLEVGSMLLASANNIIDKRLVRDHEPSPLLYLASFAVVGLPVAAVGIWIVSWPGLEAAVIGSVSGLLFAAAVLCYYWAMRLEEVSRLIPILRLSSVSKLILLGIFLNDRLTVVQYLAFALMLLGAIALAWKTSRSQCRHHSRFSPGVALMVVVSLLLAISSALDSHLILVHSPWVLVVWSNAGIALSFGFILIFPKQRARFWHRLGATSPRFRITVLGEQTGRFLTGLLSSFAVQTAGSAAITSVLAGIRPLVVMLMAAVFLGERLNREEIIPKLIGIGCICIGTGLLFWA